MSLSFIQITDTHLLDHGDDELHGVNTRDSFAAVLKDATSRYHDLDFILLTGDVSQTESAASYEICKDVLAEYEIPAYALPGNHDDRKLLKNIFPSTPDEAISVVSSHETPIILLDSKVDDFTHGELSQQQLEQLEEQLASSDGGLIIVAIHHPPVCVRSKWMDELRLRNGDEFINILKAHGHKTILLCGHAHQELDQKIDNIRLMISPAACFQFVAGLDEAQREEPATHGYRYIRLNSAGKIETVVHYLRA